jgi:membrane protease YdiL (CAAX protease family)
MDDETKPADPSPASGPEAPVHPDDVALRTGPAPPVSGPPPRREPVLWGVRDLVLFVAFAVVWLFLSQLLSLTAYAALRPIMGWQTPPQALGDNAYFALATQAVFYGPLLLYIVVLVVVHYRQPFWAGIRWRSLGLRQSVRFFFGGILLAFGVLLGFSLLPDHSSFPLEKLFSSAGAAYALGAFAVLIAPFMEELIFRAVFFSFFEYRVGLGFAVAATAVLFAAMHVPEYWGAWSHVLMILLVGLVFSLARGITGSLVPSVILHTAYNAALMSGLFLGTHHFQNLQTLSII